MTTIVVHGTLAYGSSWYQSSWDEGGFLAALHAGMTEADGWHDIWAVDGEPVNAYPTLGGMFEWNGLAEGIYRGVAAQELAEYLSTVAELTNESIRIIAHSHGCNVVKLASSLNTLSPNVFIEQAVFLACPHFHESEYTQEELSWQDRLDIRKVSEAYKATGRRYRYRVDPQRFGRILNVYCEKDKVQVDMAQNLSGGQVPLTGNFLQNVLAQFSGGVVETPVATRVDLDEQANYLYENLEVYVENGCSGIKAHSVMHGAHMGMLAGVWLNSHESIDSILNRYGEFPVLPCWDTGE